MCPDPNNWKMVMDEYPRSVQNPLRTGVLTQIFECTTPHDHLVYGKEHIEA